MTTANIITLVRIAMIPLFMVVAQMGGHTNNIWAIVIFAVASLTDGIDGHIARKYNQITDFGKFVDPLADKLLVLAALLMFTSQGIVPAWATMVILAREFIISSLRMVASAQGTVIQASIWGKVKTFTQLICILILFTSLRLMALGPVTLGALCVWVMVLAAAVSGAVYLKDNFSVISDGVKKKGA